MKTLTISHHAYKALKAAAVFPLDESTVRKGKSGIIIQISDTTLAALTRHRAQHETYSDVILRILTFAGFGDESGNSSVMLH